MNDLDEVRDEVERLHDFLAGWFQGTLPESAFEGGIAARLHSEFENMQLAGHVLTRDGLLGPLRQAWGSNPHFSPNQVHPAGRRSGRPVRPLQHQRQRQHPSRRAPIRRAARRRSQLRRRHIRACNLDTYHCHSLLCVGHRESDFR